MNSKIKRGKIKLNDLPLDIRKTLKEITKYQDLPQYIKDKIMEERIAEIEEMGDGIK